MLLLLCSIILVFLSSWNLNTFLRLSNASTYYSNDQSFEDSCYVSKTYVKGGKGLAIAMVCLSVILLLISFWDIIHKK